MRQFFIKEGDKLLVEPVRKDRLLALLDTLKPIDALRRLDERKRNPATLKCVSAPTSEVLRDWLRNWKRSSQPWRYCLWKNHRLAIDMQNSSPLWRIEERR
jgi:hypothetical protein